MAFAPVWEVLSTDYEDRDPHDSFSHYQGHGELRKLEVWEYDGPQEHKFVNEILSPGGLSQWLQQTPPTWNGSSPVSGIKLLMMIGSGKADEVRQQRTDELQTVLKAFNLPRSISTCYEFGGRSPCSQLPAEIRIDEQESSAHYCRFLGKIGLAWSQIPRSPFVRGVVVMWEPKHVQAFADLLQRYRKDIDLPLILVFLASLVYLQAETHSIRHHENGIRYAELQTGYHSFRHTESQDRGMTKEDHAELSAYVSGKAGLIALLKYRLSDFGDLLALVTEENKKYIASNASSSRQREDLPSRLLSMQKNIDTLQQLCCSYLKQAECLRDRASIQLTALFNLISKKDQNLSIEIAKDSKTLALESKRDSSSMKTLAAVTMLFLPGTFVASLFAMPLFNWDAEGTESVTGRRLWIYWVVSLPLTLLTVLGWWFWMVSKVAREEREDADARASIEMTRNRSRSQPNNFRDFEKGVATAPVPRPQTPKQTSNILWRPLQRP